jgi:membrane protein DedA with SNARE-associated domain
VRERSPCYPQSLEQAVLQWVASYGYFAIFALLVTGIVGLPIPEELMLTSCGFLISQGHLRLAPTALAAASGSICGITCSYMIGRTFGWTFLHSRLGRLLRVTDSQIQRVHDWFDHVGHWALMIGYFIPGVRHFTAIVAGTTRLELRAFAAFAYSGAIVWVSTFLFLGYHFGARWKEILALVERNLTVASVAGGVVLAAYLGLRFYRARRRRPAA